MRKKDHLEGVTVFVAVAEAGSFADGAKRLSISPSAASQAIRSLEARLGTPLLRRSTRSLSLTDVGSDYLLAVAPALSTLRRAAEDAAGRGGRPSGSLRLTMSRAPFDLFLADAIAAFQDTYPDVELEISVEARMVDIVREGLDAGLRYGNSLQKDMVGVPVAPESEAILVASPSYLQARSVPTQPGDLLGHRALACRSQITGLIKPWVLRSGEKSMQIAPPMATVVHDLASQIQLAVKGMGIVSAPEASVCEHLIAGRLERILPAWSTSLDALYLYYPSSRHQSATLRAFIAFLKGRTAS